MMYLSFFLFNFVSCFVNGVTNSSVGSINRDPCNYCNVQLTCQCTDLGKAVDSLKVKLEKFTGLNNSTLGSCGAIKSVEAKVESLIKQNNKTSGVGDAVKSLEAKVKSLFALTNKTFGISDVVKSLEAKVESLTGLNNKTSGVSDAVKSLEAKVESLFGLINRSFIPQTAVKPTASACPNMAILTGTSGIITSPSYPENYGNYHNCSWKIMASTGNRVKLVIQDMDIESGTNCRFDYIQIQNAVIYGSGVLPGRLCGSLTSNSTFFSYHETLTVRFVTDLSQTARGFKARYTVIPDRWQRLNRSPVCFGAKGDKFGNFSAPAGRLAAIKLVYLYGYVSCRTLASSYWSYWGCGDNPTNGKNTQVNVVITNSSNHILLPPNQFIHDVTNHQTWYTIPGYNSLSPELVLSVFLNPISLSSKQVLRLWYGEDLANQSEGDNGGRVCADLYSTYD